MGQFVYRAVDLAGRPVMGVVEARDQTAAQLRLQKSFRHIVELRERKKGAIRGVSTASLLLFTQQFAAMMQAAVPVMRALDLLAEGDDPILTGVAADLSAEVLAGRSLSSAMMDYPHVFPRIYCSLLTTAEASGTMHLVLERLSILLAWEADLRKRVLSILMYPVALLLLAGGVCALIVYTIFPALEPLFSTVGMELPAPTRWMIAIADFLRSPWTTVAGLAVVLAGWWLVRRLREEDSKERGGLRYRLDTVVLHLPVVGAMVRQSFGSRTLFSMALMLEAGVHLNEIFRLLHFSVDNARLRERLAAAHKTMLEGNTLAYALREHDVFPGHAVLIVGAGEESGRLPEMMRIVSKIYEQDLEANVERLGAALEPLVLGVMGTVIGFICIASLLPVMKFVQQI